MKLRRTKMLQTQGWAGDEGPRVLIEGPDIRGADEIGVALWSKGWSVAYCAGPQKQQRQSCPLLGGDACPLAEGADVIVMSSALADGSAIRSDHRWHGRQTLLVEPGETVTAADVAAAALRP